MADLDDLRARIDQLDGALIAIVAERLAVCRQVADGEGRQRHAGDPTGSRARRAHHPPPAGDRGRHRPGLRRAVVPRPARRDASHRGRRPSSRCSAREARGHQRVARRRSTRRHPRRPRRRRRRTIVAAAARLADPALRVPRGRHWPAVRRRGICRSPPAASRSCSSARERLAGRRPSTWNATATACSTSPSRCSTPASPDAALADAGAPLITDVVVDADGHEQFFAGADPASRLQLGFISRSATASASARTTCWPCSTRSDDLAVNRPAIGSAHA